MPATHIALEPSHTQALATAFDLCDVTAIAHTSKVYALQAAQGDFILRFYNEGVSHAHLQAIQTVRFALAEAGLPVGNALRTAAGTTIIEWNGVLGELQAWIPRDP